MDDTRYQLPKDAPEHERLDRQSASLVAVMNDRPFHAPLSNPRKILDIGCGTGYMTHLLGSKYPEAQVFGVDIAPVPESRHGNLDNVQYVQGDIRDLIGVDPREWPEYIASIARLLKPGGWLEAQEPSMQLRSSKGEPLADGMLRYQGFKPDAAAMGLDSEIGTNLHDIFQSTPVLEGVQESEYRFSPTLSEDAPELHALQGQIPDLFAIVVTKVSGVKKGGEKAEELAKDIRSMWERGFNKGDHFRVHAVTGQKNEN